ncbi:MAG TPA: acyltransferase [Puia sp.]|jgi:peptidoglycan/LPS O-acetylase OafA/YrhL|nr:acyltransferase [Puia sp.]
MNETSHPTRRFLYLDSARGLAAMSVVVWHFIAAFSITNNNRFFTFSPAHFFWYGEADVVFFFIHSGFILTYAYANRQSKLTAGNYLRFLIERIFRIYPLFLFILIISFLLQKNLYPIDKLNYVTEKFHSFWQDDFSFNKLLKSAALIFSVSQQSVSLIPQDWTLAIEIIIGPFVPLLAFILKRNKLQWLFWMIVFILIFLLRINTYLFEFALGIFLFYNWQIINNAWRSLNRFLRILMPVIAVVLYTCIFHFSSLFDFSYVLIRPGADRFIVAIGCGLFFCIIISSGIVQKIMSFPLLVKIGKACYSLYLWHMIFLICFADFFMQWLNKIIIIPQSGSLIIFFILYMILNLLLSQVTYKFIEIPFNRLGKRIGRHAEILLNKFIKP